MSYNQISVEIKQGSTAPRYTTETELSADKAIITEQAMRSGLPLVDIQMTDKDGNKYWVPLSGRIINMISSAVKGVNMRNHGIEEP